MYFIKKIFKLDIQNNTKQQTMKREKEKKKQKQKTTRELCSSITIIITVKRGNKEMRRKKLIKNQRTISKPASCPGARMVGAPRGAHLPPRASVVVSTVGLLVNDVGSLERICAAWINVGKQASISHMMVFSRFFSLVSFPLFLIGKGLHILTYSNS